MKTPLKLSQKNGNSERDKGIALSDERSSKILESSESVLHFPPAIFKTRPLTSEKKVLDLGDMYDRE